MTTPKKKLIEVALPLDAINKASAREKSLRHGHPNTLHLWWARRPLAAARAVIFAQMVDDPSAHPDLFRTEKAQAKERQRLFKIIEDLVQWESTTNEKVLQAARDEIWQSWRAACSANVDHPLARELFNRHRLPAFHDPFAGGGALPLEAQRLGLEAHASDLNPVAVLINKAMIEIPPKFNCKAPVNPRTHRELTRTGAWKGVQGLAEDLRYYGQWMRDGAEKQIGHLYPQIEITPEMARERKDLKPLVGHKLTAIAWLWARTVKSPNPAFSGVDVPLASTFMLSMKGGKEAYVEPVVTAGGYRFAVRVGAPQQVESAKNGTKLARGANFRCLMSETPIASDYIYREANAGRMGSKLLAIATEGDRGRIYLSPSEADEAIARHAKPTWKPDLAMPDNPRWFSPPLYGLRTFGDLFSPRQAVALTTFSDLVLEAGRRASADAVAAGFLDDHKSLDSGGTGAQAYGEAVASFLALAVDKAADYWSTICFWHNGAAHQKIVNTFGRQAIPMSWDYAEANPFSTSSGHFLRFVSLIGEVLDFALPATPPGKASQQDAARAKVAPPPVVSTDPPYFDNIGYADLSDYFYVWLRRTLKGVYPDLFSTLAVPKAEELIATPQRHGTKAKAEAFFLDGMTQAMRRLAEQGHPAFPVTIYYAFKQAENDSEQGVASTGWETFLDAVIRAGFSISGTWPMRTEYTGNLKKNVSSLASSIVLVCRKRDLGAPTVTRREFLSALKAELPAALTHLQNGNIAPVDLAQAAIGPGMAVYTRYANVLDAKGESLAVREALRTTKRSRDGHVAGHASQQDAHTGHQPGQGGLYRSALLRQHRVRRPLRLLLHVAAPVAEAFAPDLFATLAVPKVKNWSPRPTAMVAETVQRSSS